MQALREVRGSQRVTSQNPEATYEALERYGRDLTRLAGQVSWTRSSDATRLSRRTKNKTMLVLPTFSWAGFQVTAMGRI